MKDTTTGQRNVRTVAMSEEGLAVCYVRTIVNKGGRARYADEAEMRFSAGSRRKAHVCACQQEFA